MKDDRAYAALHYGNTTRQVAATLVAAAATSGLPVTALIQNYRETLKALNDEAAGRSNTSHD